MTYSEFDTQFFRLTLELDKHIDGYIDAYGGPADLKTAVSAAPKRPPARDVTLPNPTPDLRLCEGQGRTCNRGLRNARP